MKVFLSWSGERSRAVAEALREWLPAVIQEVEPFMSAADIEAGARWQQRLSEELEGTSFGILCVTRENQSAPWLNFEAGAIAKQVDTSRVVPLAIDLSPADVRPPLGVFQAKELSQLGLLAVLETINAQCEHPVPKLAEACNVWWPKLEPKLIEASAESEASPVRSERDLLEEILGTVRALTVWNTPRFRAVLESARKLKEEKLEAMSFEEAANARDIEKRLQEGTISADEALERIRALIDLSES